MPSNDVQSEERLHELRIIADMVIGRMWRLDREYAVRYVNELPEFYHRSDRIQSLNEDNNLNAKSNKGVKDE